MMENMRMSDRKKRRDFYQDIKRGIQQELFRELDFSKELGEEELFELIDEKIHRTALQKGIWLEERKQMRKEIFQSMRQLDILQELIENPRITEIMINGKDDIFVEEGGKLFRWENSFDSEEKLNNIIQQMVSGCNRVVNEASPIVDARLENGSRVNVVLKPIALNGPIVTIRRFPEKPMDMEKLIELGALQKNHSLFLKKLVLSGYNILISGGTGSGKTTFLNALSNYIPREERVVTIEDSAELQLVSIENLVRLETRNANAEGCLPITIRDLIRTALRMRPDSIKIKKRKSKRNKKCGSVPYTLCKDILRNVVSFFRIKFIKMIQKTYYFGTFFHCAFYACGRSALVGGCRKKFFPERIIFDIQFLDFTDYIFGSSGSGICRKGTGKFINFRLASIHCRSEIRCTVSCIPWLLFQVLLHAIRIIFNGSKYIKNLFVQKVRFNLRHVTCFSANLHAFWAVIPCRDGSINSFLSAHSHRSAAFAPKDSFQERKIIFSFFAECVLSKLRHNGKISLISHIRLMISYTDSPLFGRSLYMFLFSINFSLCRTSVHYDPVSAVPFLPRRFFIHDAPFRLKIIVHSSCILDAVRRSKNGI